MVDLMARWIDFIIGLSIFIIGVSSVLWMISENSSRQIEKVGFGVTEKKLDYVRNFLNEGFGGREKLFDGEYSFEIFVNNSQPFYKNGSVSNLDNEMVIFDIGSMGFSPGAGSVSIKDENFDEVPYGVSGSQIYFLTNLSTFDEKKYVVYFDGMNSFSNDYSISSGSDNLTETKSFPRRVDVVHYNAMQNISSMNYSSARQIVGFDFRITVAGANGSSFWSYGEILPRNVNVGAWDVPVLFQDSTGRINKGRLVINAW
jgi:hypothetical protein